MKHIAFAAVLLALSAPTLGAEGNAASGQKLFNAKGCYSCHGTVGQGGREGPRLTPALPLPAFVAQLRSPRAIMPPFQAAIVSDKDAADLHAFLESQPKPPDPKTIELLK